MRAREGRGKHYTLIETKRPPYPSKNHSLKKFSDFAKETHQNKNPAYMSGIFETIISSTSPR